MEIKAGCGKMISSDNGYICPYNCSCQINYQIGTNICLSAPEEVLMGDLQDSDE